MARLQWNLDVIDDIIDYIKGTVDQSLCVPCCSHILWEVRGVIINSDDIKQNDEFEDISCSLFYEGGITRPITFGSTYLLSLFEKRGVSFKNLDDMYFQDKYFFSI